MKEISKSGLKIHYLTNQEDWSKAFQICGTQVQEKKALLSRYNKLAELIFLPEHQNGRKRMQRLRCRFWNRTAWLNCFLHVGLVGSLNMTYLQNSD
jgi:hypothetical protein